MTFSYLKNKKDAKTEEEKTVTTEIAGTTWKSKWNQFRSRGEDPDNWWLSVILLTVAAVLTRVCFVSRPYMVIWDEVHFGKMAGLYMNRTFFLDVHPKGGKLLITLFGWLSGFNGTFTFEKPGVKFDGYPEILIMRACCGLLGASLVPMSFYSAWLITNRLLAACLAATLILFEIGTITLTRFILLDSPLMFFMMASVMGVCRLHYSQKRDGCFSSSWWLSLFFTGVMIGCVISVKFVGLFTVAAVGLFTIHSLWELFSKCNWVRYFQHILARVLCLIFVPFTIYVFCFAIHDHLLIHRFNEAEFYESHFSAGFQMNINGSVLSNLTQPKHVMYGSNVTIRNKHIGRGFLYPTNISFLEKVFPKKYFLVSQSSVKQVANQIQVQYTDETPDLPEGYYSGQPELVHHGDVVRLYSPYQNTYIAVNGSEAVESTLHKMVYSGKDPNMNGTTENDLFAVVIQGAESDEPKWRVLDDDVFFYNVKHKCYLTLSGQRLPKWASKAPEVSCGKKADEKLSLWSVEQTFHPLVENSTFRYLQTGFLSRFIETHRMMTWLNAQFKVDISEEYNQNRPWMWALNYMSHPWFGDGYRIILFGNPIIFWLNLFSVVASLFFVTQLSFWSKRKGDQGDEEYSNLSFWCIWLLLTYTLHYLPFYFMNRILYFHHYFPALQISSLLTGVFVGTFISRMKSEKVSLILMSLIVVSVIGSFWMFHHTGYGTYPNVDSGNGTLVFANDTQKWFEHWHGV